MAKKKNQKKIAWYRYILPKAMAILTGTAREYRQMPWFDDSITGNLFRLWEKIFWRKKGIRFECAKRVYEDKEGKRHEAYEFFTNEALIINLEYFVRQYIKKTIIRLKITRAKYRFVLPHIFDILTPQYAFEGFSRVPNMNSPEGYAFAITFGNAAGDTDQGSASTSFNNNGDFLYMAVNVNTNNPITGATYNGDAMTQIGSEYTTTWSGRFHSTWGLVAPDAGTHDITVNTGLNWQFVMFCASGISQTTPTSGLVTKAEETSANPTIEITTTVDGAYAIASGQMNSGSPSAGANTTQIVNDAGGGFSIHRSTDPVATAGAFTINITMSSAAWRLRGFGLNPASTSVTATPSVLAATFSLPASVISLGATIAVGVQSIVASLQAIVVSLGVTHSPSPLEATFSLPVPEILTPDALIQPSPLVATFSLPSHQVNLDMVLATSVLTAILSSPGVTVEGIALISPGVLGLTFSQPVSQINLDMVVAVAVQEITASIPGVTVIPEMRVIAGVQVLTFSIQSPTIVLEAVVLPSPVELYLSINSPFIKSTQYGRKYSVQGDSYGVKYI